MTYTHPTFIRFKFIEVHITVYKTSLQLVVTIAGLQHKAPHMFTQNPVSPMEDTNIVIVLY